MAKTKTSADSLPPERADSDQHSPASEPPVPTSFPVGSFKAAAPYLRRPFTAEAVKWKVQAGTLVVPYIDARLVIERLNLVCPHLWHDEYEPVGGGKGLLCRLTIDGITRLDVGSGYEGKGLYSDAFKRAAVKFGVGVSLYALPKVRLSFDEAHLKTWKDKKGKEHTEITDKGHKRLDSGYRAWLKQTGEQMFGEALDHGDVADSFGDVDAETAAPASGPTEDPQPEKLTDAKATALIAGAEKLYSELPKGAMPKGAFTRYLESAWHSHEALEALIAKLEKAKEAAA